MCLQGGASESSAVRAAAESAVAQIMNSRGREGAADALKTSEIAAKAAAKGVGAGRGTSHDRLLAAVLAAGGLEMSKNQPESQAAKAATQAANYLHASECCASSTYMSTTCLH